MLKGGTMGSFLVQKTRFGSNNQRALLIFAHWGGRPWQYLILTKLLRDFRIILYTYSDSLLTADVALTVANFQCFQKMVADDIMTLRERGVKICCYYGVSLGAIVATRVANAKSGTSGEESQLILRATGASFPYGVWNGTATRQIRMKLEEAGISFRDLESAWDFLSPKENLGNLITSRILFLASLDDRVICPPNVLGLIELLTTKYPRSKVITSNFNHYFGCASDLILARSVRSFLKD